MQVETLQGRNIGEVFGDERMLMHDYVYDRAAM
jgi:ABC-type ATPase involved in cell division